MAFLPGNNANPRGRPSVGASLADAIRRRFPPERIVDHAEKLLDLALEQGDVSAGAKVLQILTDRGYGKILTEAAEAGGLSPQLAAMVEAMRMTPHERNLAIVDAGEAIDVESQ